MMNDRKRNNRFTLCAAIFIAAFFRISPLIGASIDATSAHLPPNDPTRADAAQSISDSHPILAAKDRWAGTLLLIFLLGLFIPAAFAGPVMRYLMTDELPELHTDEESDAHAATQHEPGHSGSG